MSGQCSVCAHSLQRDEECASVPAQTVLLQVVKVHPGYLLPMDNVVVQLLALPSSIHWAWSSMYCACLLRCTILMPQAA